MPNGVGNPDLSSLNYTVLVPYNGSIPTGGDSVNHNVNVFYEVSIGRGRELPACELQLRKFTDLA